MNTFFTSDTHFNHKNIIRYCNRPFSSITEMNDKLVKNWNAKVQPYDIIYHCGDFMFGTKNEILQMTSRLNGRIILIEGNHDKIVGDAREYGFYQHHKMLDIKIHGKSITLSHFSMRVWNKSHFGSWNLYGHSHATLPPIGKSWDVGVDYNNYSPISFDEISLIMETRPHNINWTEYLPGYNKEEFEEAKEE